MPSPAQVIVSEMPKWKPGMGESLPNLEPAINHFRFELHRWVGCHDESIMGGTKWIKPAHANAHRLSMAGAAVQEGDAAKAAASAKARDMPHSTASAGAAALADAVGPRCSRSTRSWDPVALRVFLKLPKSTLA